MFNLKLIFIISIFFIILYFYHKKYIECYNDIPKNAFYKDSKSSYYDYDIIGGISGTNWIL